MLSRTSSQNFVIPGIQCRFVGLYIVLYNIIYVIKASTLLLVSLLVHLGITSNETLTKHKSWKS